MEKLNEITDQDIINNKLLREAVYDHKFLAHVRDVIINHEVPHPEFIIRGYLHQGRVMSVNTFPPEVSECILVDLADKARKGQPWIGYETTPRKVYEVRVFNYFGPHISENPGLRDVRNIPDEDWSGEMLFRAVQEESDGASLIIVHGAYRARYDTPQSWRKNNTETLLGLSRLATYLNAAIVVDSPGPCPNPLHESLVDAYLRKSNQRGSGFWVSFRADYVHPNERFHDDDFYAEFENGELIRKTDPMRHECDCPKEVAKDIEKDDDSPPF
jgi:hypothetical protein